MFQIPMILTWVTYITAPFGSELLGLGRWKPEHSSMEDEWERKKEKTLTATGKKHDNGALGGLPRSQAKRVVMQELSPLLSDFYLYKNLNTYLKIPYLFNMDNDGQPRWLSGLAPALGLGHDPGDPGSNLTLGSRRMEPASPSAYVSACLSLCVTIINK